MREYYGEDEEAEPPAPPVPVEPSRQQLSGRDDTRRKMEKVADEITRLLQDEQRRQRKYY